MYALLVSLHLLAATIWTGGHIVLFAAVLLPALKSRDPARISAFESNFEKIGIPALLTLVTTGIWMATLQLPRPQDWFTLNTVASRTIVMKLGLLTITVVLALHARLRLIPRLSKETLNQLALHITLVTATSIAFALTGVLHRFGGIW